MHSTTWTIIKSEIRQIVDDYRASPREAIPKVKALTWQCALAKVNLMPGDPARQHNEMACIEAMLGNAGGVWDMYQEQLGRIQIAQQRANFEQMRHEDQPVGLAGLYEFHIS